VDEVNFFRYRERFHLSAVELNDEPLEDIKRAFLIWSLDSERAKFEERKAQS
jgi:hypothetical protein